MVRFRLLVAWLMLLLVPLQGLAAASKFCCAARSDHHAASDRSTSPGRDIGAFPAHHANMPAAALHKGLRAAVSGPPPMSPDLGQVAWEGCGVCVSLCHAVGITQAFVASPVAAMRSVEPTEAFALPAEQPFTVADKPPRARRA